MKLACIYNVWDGVELLRGSMECRKNNVELFIIVYQDVSNYGEIYDPLPEMNLDGFNCVVVKYTPWENSGTRNEIAKRNLGLNVARENKCTHYLFSDCDEYFEDFNKSKQMYVASGRGGSVCKMYTYFKKPTLRFENMDGYYVPFIHKLTPGTIAGVKEYPFYVDPTRRTNERSVCEIHTPMHHFSWVRNDIERKIRNSSAKKSLESGSMLIDYYCEGIGPGYYVKDYGQRLVEVPNYFNIGINSDK